MTNKTNAIEKCVSCSKDTPYTFNENINTRYYYIEGVGQLCKECYDELYAYV